jgi:hypothetical protein
MVIFSSRFFGLAVHNILVYSFRRPTHFVVLQNPTGIPDAISRRFVLTAGLLLVRTRGRFALR